MSRKLTVPEMNNATRRRVYREHNVASDRRFGVRRFYVVGFRTWVSFHLFYEPWRSFEV